MIRGRTETGSLFIGLVHGHLLDRLRAGERVFLPKHVDGNGLEHPALYLDFSGGPRAFEHLLAGHRVCVPRVCGQDGQEVHPHVCLIVRENNTELAAALNELFPGGPLPGALFEHVSPVEPE